MYIPNRERLSSWRIKREARRQAIANVYHTENLTLQETGDRFGITRERVRQIVTLLGMSRGYNAPSGYVTADKIVPGHELQARKVATIIGIRPQQIAGKLLFTVAQAKLVASRINNPTRCENCDKPLIPGRIYKYPWCSKCMLKLRYMRVPGQKEKQALYSKRWRENNRERWDAYYKVYHKEYCAKNPEKIKAWREAYYKKNKAKMNRNTRERYQKNREHILKQKAEWYRRTKENANV